MDVSFIDITYVFIQTCVEENRYMLIIKIRGVFVDILCKFLHNTRPMYLGTRDG